MNTDEVANAVIQAVLDDNEVVWLECMTFLLSLDEKDFVTAKIGTLTILSVNADKKFVNLYNKVMPLMVTRLNNLKLAGANFDERFKGVQVNEWLETLPAWNKFRNRHNVLAVSKV